MEYRAIEQTPGTVGGRIRLAGHRISMAQIVEYLAHGWTVAQFARDFEQDPEQVKNALLELAALIDTSNLK